MGVDITSSVLYGIEVKEDFFEKRTLDANYMVPNPAYKGTPYDPMTGKKVCEYLSTTKYLTERLNYYNLADEFKLDIINANALDHGGPYYIGKIISKYNAKREGGATSIKELDFREKAALEGQIVKLATYLNQTVDLSFMQMWHLLIYS